MIPSPTLFVDVQRDLPGQLFVGGGLALPMPVWRRQQGELALARAERSRVEEERTLVERDVALEVERAFQAEAAQREMSQLIDREVLPAAEAAVTLDDRGVAGRKVRSVPTAADVARRERGAAALPRDARVALGIDNRPRSRRGCAMTKNVEESCSWSWSLVIALVVRGRAGVARAARRRARGETANAATPPARRRRRHRPLSLSAAARAKNPVKVAPAELTKLAGDIQVVGTVTFHEDHFAVVGPLVPGRISRAGRRASATRSSAGR